MAEKRNTTPGGLDYARQSIVESTETRSLDASPSDDLDNTQELPNVESKERPRMIDISNNTEIATLIEEPEISLDDEVGADIERILMNCMVHKADWEGIKYYLYPDKWTAKLSSTGENVLHLAVLGGHIKIVEELVQKMSATDLAIPNKSGETALSLAAAGGITKLAKCLVRENHYLLGMKNSSGNIPVVVAALFGHVDMVHYLYWETQEEYLDPETSDQGGKLLTTCIGAQIYEVALDLVKEFPGLAIEGESLHKLASRQSVFASGTQLMFWKQWIYSCGYFDSL